MHLVGLSDVASAICFYTPVVDGKPFIEESSIFANEFEKPWIKERLAKAGTSLTFSTFKSDVEIGDSFGFKPHLIKIDVEGAEFNVLKGLQATLRLAWPVLLIENSDWGRVTPFLNDLGYHPFMYDAASNRLLPFSGHRTNTIYLRPEHITAQLA